MAISMIQGLYEYGDSISNGCLMMMMMMMVVFINQLVPQICDIIPSGRENFTIL